MIAKGKMRPGTSACSGTEVEGLVFDVKRFAIHDGPGIRTTVFFKGCPLACRWCHNPESQQGEPEIFFSATRCVGCGACVPACPVQAVRLRDGKAATDREACTGCGRCVEVCLERARSMVGRRWTLSDLVRDLERDLLFYESSGGGITLSGGEPLAQPEFALGVLREAKARGMTSAVDTCGHCDPDVMEEAAGIADLFLYDFKLMDSRRHAAATGVGNERVLDNARRLSALGARMWARVPLIPGVNDREDDVEAIGRFVRDLRGVEAIQVLPYHSAGEGKWERLERPSWAEKPQPPAPERVKRLADLLEAQGRRRVTIGG